MDLHLNIGFRAFSNMATFLPYCSNSLISNANYLDMLGDFKLIFYHPAMILIVCVIGPFTNEVKSTGPFYIKSHKL